MLYGLILVGLLLEGGCCFIANTKNSVCYGCQKRNAMCRIGCKDWDAEQREIAREKELHKSERTAEHDIIAYRADRRAKSKEIWHKRRR